MGAIQGIYQTVEVDSSTDTFTFTDGGGAVTVYPSQNVFPNVLALMSDIDDQLVGRSIYPSTATSGHRIVLSGSGTITAIGGTVSTMLGFDGTETGASTATATYIYKFAWLPTYGYQSSGGNENNLFRYSADTNWFKKDASAEFSGTRGVDGNLSGVAYDVQYQVTKEWKWILATNAIYLANSATTIRAERSFDYIIRTARTKVPQYTTSNNQYLKGVYYIPDITIYFSPATMPTSWGSGSINGDYVFCSAGVPQIPGSSAGDTKKYYDCSLELVTATAPDWGWDIS
jgi:hypothetical protein